MEANETAEEAFGRAVAFWRGARHLSQRQLADRLTERGMRADAPAVSRIESGARSVRLTEAVTIAEVLDVDLEALVSASRSPAQRLHRLRRLATFAMRELEVPLSTFIARLIEVQLTLVAHPELIASLPDADDAPATDAPDDYLDWVRMRIRAVAARRSKPEQMHKLAESGQVVVVPSEEIRRDLLDVVELFAASHIFVDHNVLTRAIDA